MRTERGLDRLVNFSDATVAIAITLLVLPSLDFAGDAVREGLGPFLAEHWPVFFAFVLSFAVIGNLWTVHHQLFEYIGGYDPPLVWLNLLWMLSIVVIPLATSMIAAGTATRGVSGFYIATMFVSSCSLLAIRYRTSLRPELQRDGADEDLKLAESFVPTAILFVAMLLAILVPAAGVYGLCLLFASGPIEGAIGRRKVSRREARGAS